MEELNILKNKEKSKILARVVAHLMGDGCVTNKYFAYYNKNETLLNDFEKDIYKLFGKIHIIRGKTNSGTSLLMVCKKPLLNFLKHLISDYRSFALYIPKFIDNKILQKEFLSSFYDDEGCVGLRNFRKTNEIKRNLTLSSNSLQLLREIKNILVNNFLIFSNKISKYVKIVEDKKFTNYVLSITGKENFIKFKEEIGFSHPLKIKRLNKMINSYIRK